MGNQATRTASSHRKQVIHSWTVIYNHNPNLLNDAISTAWLRAAELTPTWVWALVDLPETMHATYRNNEKFMNMISRIRDFLHVLIKIHKCDPEMIKTLGFSLGGRHRQYMSEGKDNSYWAPFAQQLPIAMTQTYMNVVNSDNKMRRILRIGARHDLHRSEEEELQHSWREFSNALVEAIKRGYEGCAAEKTPLRLSITNSIISMASVRSTRSRSTTHLEPSAISPAIACPASTAVSAPALHARSQSIFRNRPARSSQDLSALRRLSSPNNNAINMLNTSDLQLLRLTTSASSDGRKDGKLDPETRRSLTIIPMH